MKFDYDIFLSHASADKPTARELAERLRGDGLEVWFQEAEGWGGERTPTQPPSEPPVLGFASSPQPTDRSHEQPEDDGTRPGGSDPLAMARGLERSRTLVLLMSGHSVGGGGGPEWAALEPHTALFRDPTNRERRFIPLRLDDCAIPDVLKPFAYVDWRQRDGDGYRRLLALSSRPLPPPAARGPSQENAQDGPPLRPVVLGRHEYGIRFVLAARDGRLAVSGSIDGQIKVWDLASRTCRAEGRVAHGLCCGAVSEDGRKLLTGSRTFLEDREKEKESIAGRDVIEILGLPDLRPIRTFPAPHGHGHEGHGVSGVCFLPGGDAVASVGWDYTLKIHGVNTGALHHRFEIERGPGRTVGRVFTLPDGRIGYTGFGRRIAIRSPDGRHDLAALEEIGFLFGRFATTAVSPDASSLLGLSSEGSRTITQWDLEALQPVGAFEGHTAKISALDVTADGRYAVSTDRDFTIKVWAMESGQCLRTLKHAGRRVRALAIIPGQPQVIIADWEHRISILELGAFEDEAASATPTERYTNAKVLLVGDSGVGKSGLAIRLTENEFRATVSTDGHWATQLKLPHEGRMPVSEANRIDANRIDEMSIDAVRPNGSPTRSPASYPHDNPIHREIWLWDFAGQSDYRLIHQLFMDETALAVLVFNPQSETPFEGLRQWDRGLHRAARRAFAKLLVAGRCDRGRLRVSKEAALGFAGRQGFAEYLETSALSGEGCHALRAAIVQHIDWDRIPWTASPRIFKLLKDEILLLRDEGVALLRLGELKQQLEMRLVEEEFTLAELETVVGLLAAPGLVQRLAFGGIILLQPEWINKYAAAVIRSIRANIGEIGVIDEGRVLMGDLEYTLDSNRSIPRHGGADPGDAPPQLGKWDLFQRAELGLGDPRGELGEEGQTTKLEMQRLGESEEAIVLRAMHQMFVDHGLCVREVLEGGGRQLVFPSYFKQELPTDPGHPPVLVSYRFDGDPEDIYATLIVQLWQTRAFENGELWRNAADFKSNAENARLGLKMALREDGGPEISVYFDPRVQDDTRVTFIKYVHEHLLQKARAVTRLREFVCPHCGHPVRDTALARTILEEEGKDAEIRCQQRKCDKRFPLWDIIERKFASPEFQQRVRELEEKARAAMDNESRELILEGHARVITGEAGQIYRGYTGSDHGIDGEIEFKDDMGQASGRRLYLQLKSGDSYLTKRKSDGQEIFRIKKARWADYWRAQAYPVMLVIRTSDGVIRWMNVTEYLEEKGKGRDKPVRQIVFDGEPFTALNLQRMRGRV